MDLCIGCGRPLGDTETFCMSCGARRASARPTPTEGLPTPQPLVGAPKGDRKAIVLVGLVLVTIAVVAAAVVVFLTSSRDEAATPSTPSTTEVAAPSAADPEPGSVLAAVTYEDAQGRQVAVAGVTVTVADETGAAVASGRTDAAGTAVVDVPDEGTYRVGVDASTLPEDVQLPVGDAVRVVRVGAGEIVRAAFGAVVVVPDTTLPPPTTTTEAPPDELTGAEPGLIFDVGMIEEWNLVMREISFDRYQVCAFEGCWIDGPAITREPVVVASDEQVFRNVNRRLRLYPLANDIEILAIVDTAWLTETCAREDVGPPPWARLTLQEMFDASIAIGAPDAYALTFDRSGLVTRIRLLTQC